MTLTMPCQAFGWHCPSPPACAWLCRTAPHSGKASIPLRLIRVSEIGNWAANRVFCNTESSTEMRDKLIKRGKLVSRRFFAFARPVL